MAELKQQLCPTLLPFHYRGELVGLKASLADSLRLHLQRLIQTGQAEFFLTANTSLVCEVTTGVDGRGGEKVHNWNTISFFNTISGYIV